MTGPIMLEWSLWCPRHLEPLRPEWPKGAPAAMLGLFNALVRDDRIVAMTGGHVDQIPGVFKELGFACCSLGDAIAEAIMTAALAVEIYGKTA